MSTMNELDSLVEATVDCVYFDRGKQELRIEVSCVWGEKGKKAIVASGIHDLLVDDFGMYNVVDRVNLFVEDDAIEEINDCTSSLFFMLQKRELTTLDFQFPAFKERLASIRSGKLRLIEIEPVAGVSVLVLSEQIRIELISLG
jgi:hypothetical protein